MVRSLQYPHKGCLEEGLEEEKTGDKGQKINKTGKPFKGAKMGQNQSNLITYKNKYQCGRNT